MKKIKTLIIEKESQDRSLILSTISKLDYIKLVGQAENKEEAYAIMEDFQAQIIIIGNNLEEDKYDLSSALTKDFGDRGIILVEGELKEDTIYKGLSAGAKDVLISPFTSSKLVDSIYRVNQLLEETAQSEAETATIARQTVGRGKTITVFSSKGGVGKTFLSTNLAVALSQNTGKKVCLVDLDLDFGNLILALDLVPRLTMADVVDDIRGISRDTIESYLIPHESGIKLLPANLKPMINDFINADHIEVILKALRGAFDYVVVDMPARFYEPVNPAFQFADILFMVTTPELSTIRNIKASIETLEELNFSRDKIKVVLNKLDAKIGIRSKDVESTLNQPVYSVINANYNAVINSLNSGKPLVTSKPRSPLSRSIFALAKKIDKEFKEKDSR